MQHPAERMSCGAHVHRVPESRTMGREGLSFIMDGPFHPLAAPEMQSLHVVIMAAGLGKRMRSDLPKVLHPVGGRPMLAHVLEAARALAPARIVVVVGHGGETVRAAFPQPDLSWVTQDPPQGTGHAVRCALADGKAHGTVLVLNGDVPLVDPDALRPLIAAASEGRLAIQTQSLPNPAGYGRVVRERLEPTGRVLSIVEDRDASADERKVAEVYTGVLAAPIERMQSWVAAIGNDNAQGEYYLTDVIAMAALEGVDIATASPRHEREMWGINSKAQLAEVERAYQRMLAARLMDDGVTLADPDRVDIRGTLEAGRDVTIAVGTVFVGHVRLGDRDTIGAHCVVADCATGDDTVVLPFTHLSGATIGAHCELGPYAHVHPDTVLEDHVAIGNFVEVKRSRVASGSKAKHLSYLGDATVGRNVNVGAGTICCNYDGANKHKTVIEDDVHIGSDTQLVAPVTVGRGATIGAGTTVWKDVEPGVLVLNTKKQMALAGWQRPVKGGKAKLK
jgi:bifunctional UDP-N-acetylglucosamine pyrophosphorylase/glucosamine-1-phosphate N-acetyltransferase